MTILSSEFYYDETMPEYREPVENESGWSQNGVGAYVISSEKAGVMANVTFDNISPTAWSCLAYDASSGGKTVAVLTLRNNGSEKVLYGIDWNSEANRQYGFLEAGETKEVRLENASASGVINFFLDSCYDANDPSRLPDKEEYSGDVDIVSLTYEEGDTPVVPVTPGWAGAAVYTVSEKDGITNVVYEGIAPSGWTCIAYDTADANGKTAAILTIRNNGTEKVLYGIDWNDQNARVYGFIEPGDTVSVEVSKPNTRSAAGPINIFIDSCYDAGYENEKPTSFSGRVTILSVTYSNETTVEPAPESPWTANSNYFTADGNTITFEGLPIGSWTGVTQSVSLAEAGTYVLSVTNNSDHWMKFKLNLQDETGAQIGSDSDPCVRRMEIPAGETYELTLTVSAEEAASARSMLLMIDCWAAGDKVTETGGDCPAGPYSGSIVTGELTLKEQPEQPEEPDDPEPEEIYGKGTWGVVDSGKTFYTFTAKEGTMTNVTYQGVSPTLWANLYYEVSEEECYQNVTVTLRNNGTIKVLYGIDLGDDTKRAYGFLDDCYYGDPYVAPEGTLSGDVDIVSVAFSGELLQKPAEPSGPVTISLTWGLNNDATLISLAGNVVTLNGIVPDGAWQQINAGISLESKAVTLKLSVTNSTNALAKFKLCVMDEGWQQIGADSSASVCWIEIPKDATWDIVLTLTAEEAAKAAHLMLAIDCWASTDATCPDEDAFTGTVTINSLTVS